MTIFRTIEELEDKVHEMSILMNAVLKKLDMKEEIKVFPKHHIESFGKNEILALSGVLILIIGFVAMYALDII